jgi:hypothetical protein
MKKMSLVEGVTDVAVFYYRGLTNAGDWYETIGNFNLCVDGITQLRKAERFGTSRRGTHGKRSGRIRPPSGCAG